MFMVSRAIACGLLLFAPCLYGQDNSLERPASDFDSKGVGLTETFLKFSHQQHLRIAVEYVDRASIKQPITVNLQNKTVRQGLDTILQRPRIQLAIAKWNRRNHEQARFKARRRTVKHGHPCFQDCGRRNRQSGVCYAVVESATQARPNVEGIRWRYSGERRGLHSQTSSPAKPNSSGN